MKLDKNYSIQNHHRRVMSLVQAELGDGVEPLSQKVDEIWKERANGLPPRCFMFIYDVKTGNTYRSKGLSIFGLPDSSSISAFDLMKRVHENQIRLVFYQTLRLHEMFISQPYLMAGPDIVYTTKRGMKIGDGTYWLFHQLGEVLQRDSNGRVTKYLSTYRAISPYQGEPLETKIFASDKNPEQQRLIDFALAEVKKSMLSVLGFSAKEQSIIQLISERGLSAREIAKKKNRSKSTIENHKLRIMEKARIAFPLNEFKKTEDVVKYLQEQLII